MEDLVAKIDQDRLRFRVRSQCMLATLTTDTALLCAAEWSRRMDSANAVHAHYTRVDGRADPQGALNVLGEHACHQAILAVVATSQDVGLVLELIQHGHRTKDLFSVDESIVFGVSEDGRFDEETLAYPCQHLVLVQYFRVKDI